MRCTRSILAIITVLALVPACGGSRSDGPSSPVVVANRPAPPAPPSAPAVPADFAISSGGGPVAAWMAAGMTLTRSHIEPASTVPGAFDAVVESSLVDEMGHHGPAREVRRSRVSTEDLSRLHEYIQQHLAELEGPCMDMNIRDGGHSTFGVVANGRSHTFSCVNASTDAFAGLSERYAAVLDRALGS